MVGKAKPIKTSPGPRFPSAPLNADAKEKILDILDVDGDEAVEVIREIEAARSEGKGRMQWALQRPTATNLLVELRPIIPAVKKAHNLVKGLSSYARAMLRGTDGEGNPAEANFLLWADALEERAAEVVKKLEADEDGARNAAKKINGRNTGSPNDGGGRKILAAKERQRERSAHEEEFEKLFYGHFENQKTYLEAALQRARKKGKRGAMTAKRLEAQMADLATRAQLGHEEVARWTPMRTTLIQIYERYAKRKNGRKKFLEIAEKGL